MKQFKLLDRNGKIRLVAFLILMALSVTAVQMAAGTLAGVGQYLKIINTASKIDQALNKDNPYVTWLLSVYADIGNLSAVLLGAVLLFLLMLSHVVVLGIFSFFAFKAKTITADTEYLLSVKLQKGICILSAFIACLQIAVRSFVWGVFGIVFIGPMVLFSWLFYLLPLQEKRKAHP